MNSTDLLKEASRLGLRLERVGTDQLTFTPAAKCPGYLWDAMRGNRQELLHKVIIREFLSAAGVLGGTTAQSRRTPKQRSQYGQMMARARWRKGRKATGKSEALSEG